MRAPSTSTSTSAAAAVGGSGGGTGSGAWGKSTTAGSNKGYSQTLSLPGSGAVTPRSGPSRPVTPQVPATAAVHGQKVVGEVGKVEDDEDWDVDA